MSHFEIEEIVSQDKQGVIYRAYDHQRKMPVVLSRFLPFGRNGGGLEKDEADSFRAVSEILSSINHPSFRSILGGHVDPIDSLPFIAAEWIPGDSVKDLAHGHRVDAGIVIDILHQAIEVSLSLSSILGEEAVWVDTSTDSILIGSKESGRNIVFWLSPYKWLSGELSSRKAASLIELTEDLLCWKGKIIGNQACFGLGGWIKQLRADPDISPSKALVALKPIVALKNQSPTEFEPEYKPDNYSNNPPTSGIQVEQSFAILNNQEPKRATFFLTTLVYIFLALIGLAVLCYYVISYT